MKTTIRLALLAFVACFLSVVSAHGQASLSFSGGLGTVLHVTLNQPVTYTITSAPVGGFRPLFDFMGVGNAFSTDPAVNGTITYSINFGPNQPLTTLNSGVTQGAISPTDAYLINAAIPALPIGAIVTLNAGTLSTNTTFAGAPPAGGSFSTFLVDSTGHALSPNGIAVAPEPSTWAMLLGGLGLLVGARRFPRA